jgi:phosphoadenosine phosphosulfate reductase
MSEMSLGEQADSFGADLWGRDPDLCCEIRKMQPLNRRLEDVEAWITGLRRSQSTTRENVQPIIFDEVRGIVKVSPFYSWTDEQVDEYGRVNGVIVNPLTAAGYPSIGCWPCTRPVQEDFKHARAGRWAGFEKTECGMHDKTG